MQTLSPASFDGPRSGRGRRALSATLGARIRHDWPLVLAIAVAAVVTLGHAPYRDEWQAWMIARDAGSPAQLLDNLRYEGHPWLWYLPLWIVSRLSRDILAAQLLCLTIAAATQYVLWRHAPFSRQARALLVLGYFFTYEYAVFARSYGLGVLLLLLGAHALAQCRPRAAGVALGLACLTSAFTAVIAIAMAYGSWGRHPRRLGNPERLAAAAVLVSATVAYLMTRPPSDGLNGGWRLGIESDALAWTLSGPWRGTMPLRSSWSAWNTNAITQPWSTLLGTGVLLLGFVAFRQSTRAKSSWLVGSVMLLVLVYGKGFSYTRHVGHWFVLAVVCAWLLCSRRSPSMLLRRVATVALAVGVLASVQAAATDHAVPISAAPATAQWIEENLPEDAAFVGETNWGSSAVAGALDRPFWYPRTGETGTFIRWYDGHRDLTQAEIEERALAYAARVERPVYLVIAFNELESSPHLELLASFTESHVMEERYWVYRLVDDHPR